jgi:hypothetical protein
MSPYYDFNDPMEAFYEASNLTKRKIEEIRLEKRKLRICCLSKCYTNVLMWAHYADSHKGICLEVEVDSPKIIHRDVLYTSQLEQPTGNTDFEKCIDIMSHKFKPWQYEQEARFFKELPPSSKDSDQLFLNVKIKRIYLGYKLSASEEDEYKRFINVARRGLPHIAINKIKLEELTWWKNKSNPQIPIL